MLFSDIHPFVRFAEIIHYKSDGEMLYVRDSRIFYVCSGRTRIRIDQQTYDLGPDAVFYCCGGSCYSISSQGADLICLNFDFTQARCDRELPYSPIRLSAAVNLPPPNHTVIEDQEIFNHHLVLENGIALRELLDEIIDEFSTKRILYRENAGALLKSLLVWLLRSRAESASQSASAVKKIIAYINAHYEQEMTNSLFSQLSGYHEYYLNRLFIKHTGSTLRQYILDVRISHAKKMLLNTDLPLSVIAEKVGFNSNTYFSRYFRQITGITPTQFRQKYKNAI